MQFRSHRGGVFYTPENTMPAFCEALAQGYEYIETDPQLTKDGVIILMHDGAVNRTCRRADGSELEQTMLVEDMTYAEIAELDAGIAHSEAYRGTKVPRLEELLQLLDGTDVILDLDKKIPTEKMDVLFDLVEQYNVRVEFSCADTTRIKRVLERFPDAYVNYDGVNTEAALAEVCSLVRPERLVVFLYLDKPNFAWLVDRDKASPEVCARVKKYAKLGIGNTRCCEDVREAILLGADVIEV